MARTIDPTKHAAKRAEILEAAYRCFCRSGLRSISIAEICAEAEISPGHLYHYFDRKDDIVEELAQGRLDLSRRALEEALQSERGVIEVLVDELLAEAVGERATTASLLFDVLADSARNKAIARIVRDCHAGMAEMLGAVLRRGQDLGEIDPTLDPAGAAGLLIGLIDAAHSLRLRAPTTSHPQTAQLFARMVRTFLAPGAARTPTRAEGRPHPSHDEG